ncbi:TetR/AcrR family transcriptional regulator [Sinimarinibacterium thermocellulolyticum]|uniref:TetR/AcrR family transcriptional regulator n=1 Tax=Sinimarinibacterium thermocellulolyticum TaxID=3170016 RepID=A0ABV2A616_9GAMM
MSSKSKSAPALGQPLPRGRHGLGADYVRASQRARLVHAMLTLVGERGYHATTVPAVVAAARASRNAFYQFFADKQACFLAACDEASAEVVAKMKAFGAYPDWKLGLREGYAAYLQWWQDRPGLCMAFFVEMPTVGAAAHDRRARYFQPFEDMFTRLAARIRREQPALPPLPAFVPRMLVVALHENLAEQVREGRVQRLTEALDMFLYLTVKLLADDTTARDVLQVAAGKAAAPASAPPASTSSARTARRRHRR